VPRASTPTVAARLSREQVFGFRLARQFLDPRTSKSAVEVVRRLCGVQAQVASAAEFAVATRRRSPKPLELDRALRARTLVKTWAMRGTLHVFPADEAAGYVGSLSRLQPWRTKAWERYHGVKAAEVERVIEALRQVLSEEPVGRQALQAELAVHVRSKAVRDKIASGWAELLKPAAFAGVLLQGPPEGGQVTFVRADAWIRGWRLQDPGEAGPQLVRRYLRAFGPATPDHFGGWWARQRGSVVRPWFEALGDELAPVEVEGQSMWTLAEDVPTLTRSLPTDVVRLLGNFDQYVLGPASGSAAFIPAAHKAKVSRTAGWISKVVLRGGRVVGVWERDAATGTVDLDLWERLPKRALEQEFARLGTAP
jgi:hypothetical protein